MLNRSFWTWNTGTKQIKKMGIKIKICLLILTLFGPIPNAKAAPGSVDVVFLAHIPIGISADNTVELNFGNVYPDPTGHHTVTVTTSGDISATGGIVLGGTASQGQFEVFGEPGKGYAITLSVGEIMRHPGGYVMRLDRFVSDPPAAKGGVIGADGTQTLSVGARILVIKRHVLGTYTGTYDVVVNYN